MGTTLNRVPEVIIVLSCGARSALYPLADLWTTRASQGKKTLTNPYDRSLIALS